MTEPTRRRIKKLLNQKRAIYAIAGVLIYSFFSFTAEIWSNSKPLVLKHQGKTYFPVFVNYPAQDLGITDRMTVDYRELAKTSQWVLWPVNPWDPFESNQRVEKYPSGPSRENWFGTDDRGRDIFARLLYGFRYSISYAFLVWALTLFLGISFGGAMGFFGGKVDLIGQRVVEVLNTIPVLFLLIILVSIFDPSMILLIALTSCFSWISLSYYVRAEFLKNRKREFVEAARAIGAGSLRQIFRHVLPNSLVPVITFSPFIISSHVLGLASLDYLGFGLKAPTPSWGELLNQAQKNFTTAWWLAVFPSIALFSTLVMLALIGDGIRNAFDPRKEVQ
ncbi:MAG: ABC transporter permease subunit [Bdellovibrionales bacterium]|nr:ABC transporter permease subunit [Bdellovibrionales bacterium]